MKRGEAAQSGEYFEFFRDVTRAIADAEAKLVGTITTASKRDWRAGAWILERRHPERWANTQRIQIEVEKELEKVVDRLEDKLPAEIFEQVLSALADGEDCGSEDLESSHS